LVKVRLQGDHDAIWSARIRTSSCSDGAAIRQAHRHTWDRVWPSVPQCRSLPRRSLGEGGCVVIQV